MEMMSLAQKPPTADDWTSLRPLITDFYQTKQYTARQIVQELRLQGYLVTYVSRPSYTVSNCLYWFVPNGADCS